MTSLKQKMSIRGGGNKVAPAAVSEDMKREMEITEHRVPLDELVRTLGTDLEKAGKNN
jgi:hypothetical protein